MDLMRRFLHFAIRLLDGAVNLTALVLTIAMLAFAGYSLWDNNQVYQLADAAAYEVFRPERDESLPFDQLRRINPEVFAWLEVFDTNISYPIAQAKDNQKYVNTDAKGEYALHGSLFLDCANANDFSDFNHIIYGHHMEKGKMFGDLGRFAERGYFENHPYGDLFFRGRQHGVEFFAFAMVDAYDTLLWPNIQGDSERQQYLYDLLARSMYLRDIDVSTRDRLVLLTTCTTEMTNGRHILAGRITERTYLQQERERTIVGVDDPGELFQRMPVWLLVVLAAVFLSALALWWRGSRRRKANRER